MSSPIAPTGRLPIPAAGFGLLAGLFSCSPEPPPDFEFVPVTPHEQYEYGFRRVGLEESAVGRAWIRAGQDALINARTVEPPFEEVGFFDPTVSVAHGFRVSATRGQMLLVEVEERDGDGEVFIDVFRPVEQSSRPFRHLTHADSGSRRIEMSVSRTGDYVVRIQPEMLSEGRFAVRIRLAASLAFPVQGHGTDAIRSWFGAPRDGGRREHHGVDIFAPRGTPVLAGANGRISSTRRNNLGGNVVWLRTSFGSLYHAHLDSVAVRRGRTVQVGDTLGFVGNSGNARTTPPHLHFGIYARRPTDPEPFLRQPRQTPPRLRADPELIGTFVRTIAATAVRDINGDNDQQLDADVPLFVLGATGDSYRVMLPEGAMGFVRFSRVVSAADPLDGYVASATRVAARNVRPGSPSVLRVAPGDTMPVLGRFDDHVLVRDDRGMTGWITTAETAR